MRYISTALAACFTLSTLPARAIPEAGIRVLRIDRSGIHALPDLRLATTNLASKSDGSNDLVKMKRGTDDFVLQCNASLSPLTDEKIIARSEEGEILARINTTKAIISGFTLSIPQSLNIQPTQIVRVDLPAAWSERCTDAIKRFTVIASEAPGGTAVAGASSGSAAWILLPLIVVGAGALVGCVALGCFGNGASSSGGGNSSR
jgi:hypothetical protein